MWTSMPEAMLEAPVSPTAAPAAAPDSAFTPLLAYCTRLVNIAYRVLGDRDDAMDAVQEAYLQAYKGFHHFRGDAQPFTWLCRITLNECARLGRKKTTRRSREVALELRDNAPQLALVDRGQVAVENRAISQFTWAAVKSLPARYRDAVVLRYYENLSYAQIAEVMGCGLGTVKSRLFRAHHILETRLPAELLRDLG